MLNRRHAIGLALATGASPALTACAPKGQTLSLLGEDSSNLQAIRGELETFKKQYGISVTAEAADFATALTKATADFSTGAGAYDLVLQYNFSLSPFVRNDYVYSIEELKRLAAGAADFKFEDDLLPNVWRELGYFAMPPFDDLQRTQPVAYPFAANTMLLVYNREVLNDPAVSAAYQTAFGRQFAPPTSWDEFARAVLLVHQSNPALYGIALQGAAEGWLYYEWMNFLFGMGGAVMAKTYGWQSNLKTPLTIDSPETARAAEMYLRLKSANAGDFFATDAVKQRDILLEGRTAFGIVWTDYVPDLLRDGGDKFGFAPIPGDKSMIAGGSYFVSKKSRSPEGAAKLMEFLLQPDTQKRMALTGLFPPTKSALNDSEVLNTAYMPAVRDSLLRGVYMCEAGPDSDLISQEITNALQRLWRGELTSADLGSVVAKAVEAGRRTLSQ